MIWQEYQLLAHRKQAAALSRALMSLGAVGVQEDNPPGHTPHFRQPWDRGPAPRRPKEVLLRAWFRERPSDARLAMIAEHGTIAPVWQEIAEQDWGQDWKQNFDTLHISDRLVITPPWKPVPGAIVIEPGNAFGTGEHTTTRACLRAIDRYATPGGRLLDVGCGSGILALAGAKLGMIAEGNDIDADAVGAAQVAAATNGLSVDFHCRPLSSIGATFDLVVANLFAEVLADLSADLRRVAAGPMCFAGILVERADKVRAAFAACETLYEETDGDWVSLGYRNRAI